MNTPNLDNEIDKLEAYMSNDILSEQGKELLAEFKEIKQAFSLNDVGCSYFTKNIESRECKTCKGNGITWHKKSE
mgnify:CR=1 FL=1